MSEILIRNDSDQPIVLSKRTRLGKIVEYEASGCYTVDPDAQDLARRPTSKFIKQGPSWVKKALTATIAVTSVFNITTVPKTEIAHSTEITIYDSNGRLIPALTKAIEAFPNL